MKRTEGNPMRIIFFDDECLMCNSFVKLLIKLDYKDTLKFAALNSNTSAAVITNKDYTKLDSVIYKKDLQEYIYSDAVIEIMSDVIINVRFLKLIPKKLRDACYKIVAKYRKYIRLNTTKQSCDVPSIKYKEKFLN